MINLNLKGVYTGSLQFLTQYFRKPSMSNYQIIVSHFAGNPKGTVISEAEVLKSGYTAAIAMERELIVPTTLEVGTPAAPLPDSEKVFAAFQKLQDDYNRLLQQKALVDEQLKGNASKNLANEDDLKAATQKIQGLQAELQTLRNSHDTLTIENKKLQDLLESHTAPAKK